MCFGKYFTFYPGSIFVNSDFFFSCSWGLKKRVQMLDLLEQKMQFFLKSILEQ